MSEGARAKAFAVLVILGMLGVIVVPVAMQDYRPKPQSPPLLVLRTEAVEDGCIRIHYRDEKGVPRYRDCYTKGNWSPQPGDWGFFERQSFGAIRFAKHHKGASK